MHYCKILTEKTGEALMQKLTLRLVTTQGPSWNITCWGNEIKGIGFRPLLCTYRLNWARRTSWGWWDEWDDTALQTQDSKFEPWRSEAEHATSRSRRLPTILSYVLRRENISSLQTVKHTILWRADVRDDR